MKSRYIYVITLCFICLYSISKVQGQDTTRTTTNTMKNGVGVTFPPLFSKSFMTTTLTDGTKISDYGKGQIGFTFGINNTLILSKKHALFLLNEIGVLNNNTITKNIPSSINIVDAQGNINYQNITYFDIERKYHYLYLSASIGISFLKLSKKNSFNRFHWS